MTAPDRVAIALRWMKSAGAGYQCARNIIRDARRHKDDARFVSTMVRMARETNHQAVASARAAREWVQS